MVIKKIEYSKDFMKIKFDLDADLPFSKQLNLPTLTMVVRSVFEEDDQFYPQVFLEFTFGIWAKMMQ